MSHREWRIRIHDILSAIEKILSYTHGMTFEDFESDRKTVDAVIRNLIVIGEASVQLPEEITEKHRELPWFEMRGLRNFVIHEYFGVSDRIVWDTIHNDLPPLTALLNHLLDPQ
ncbi:conserved hypothetical protein [uncultured Desulfobacterium sp.]|uniref:DUF86 domain-containing protein n=1 Tax=uncultured Desulfobacterium sp. TaxID=201089 RepID=A0A445N0X1_9BACT|nr:conserved hypothetical protein [uncultured Desulfobacterium sp.]